MDVGEDKKNPFLQVCALLDLGSGMNGYAKTAHGGVFGVVLDEVMGTAANMQAGVCKVSLFSEYFFRTSRLIISVHPQSLFCTILSIFSCSVLEFSLVY